MDFLSRIVTVIATVTTVVATVYIFTAHQLWRELAIAAFWWASAGGAMTAVLAIGSWRSVGRNAASNQAATLAAEPPEVLHPAIAGVIEPAEPAPSRRAA